MTDDIPGDTETSLTWCSPVRRRERERRRRLCREAHGTGNTGSHARHHLGVAKVVTVVVEPDARSPTASHQHRQWHAPTRMVMSVDTEDTILIIDTEMNPIMILIQHRNRTRRRSAVPANIAIAIATAPDRDGDRRPGGSAEEHRCRADSPYVAGWLRTRST